MNAIDLSKELKKYKKGWVALNSEYKVVESASSFESINKKVEKREDKNDLILFPASDHYYGYIT